MKRWAKRAQAARMIMSAECNEAVPKAVACAREVAKFYLQVLKAKNPFVRLTRPGQSIEETRWWPHFVKAAEVVLDNGANVRGYVQAQFDRLAWKKGAYPYPTQLYSDAAMLAYAERRARYSEIEFKKEHAESSAVCDPHERERRKVKTWSARLHCSCKRVLRDHPNEFTAGFHKEMGTWKLVREQFTE